MTRNRLALPAKIVKRYTLDVIQGKLSPIRLAISKAHTTPFPKAPSRWESHYEYRHRSLSRFADGHLRGGRGRLIAILFDFTFVRSIFAAVYSSQGGHCYDPASLFMLLVFAFVDGYEYLSDFVRDLHDPDKGRQYRKLAGIRDDCIPQEADFTNFQQRCGSLFNAVFHVVAMRFGRVMDVDLTGSANGGKAIIIQPVPFYGSGVLSSPNAPSSDKLIAHLELVR